MISSPQQHDRRRRGFTMLEITAASIVMTMLVLLLGVVWSGMIRPTADIVVCSRLDQEAGLAEAALAADLGGSLSNPEGRIGTQPQYKFVGRLEPGNDQLWLCFDGGSPPNGVADWGPPDTVIIYQAQGNQLVRIDQTAGTSVPVSSDVVSFQAQDLGNGSVQLQLVLSYRNTTRSYTWIARDP